MSKHSNDVAQQVETLSKRTIFVVQKINRVASVVTLYNDCKTSTCCNKCIFSLTTCEVLRYAASYFSAFVGHIGKHLLHENLKHLLHENLCPVKFST